MLKKDFWKGRRVLLTGHTGFKGAWAWLWLEQMGAEISGLSMPGETSPNLAGLLGIDRHKRSILGDIRDPAVVTSAIKLAEPSIVLHMAAQALVRRSYRSPVDTFDVNVMGTLRLLEALREVSSLDVCLVVTSDKVYENDDQVRNFAEEDRLGGADPYSASKSACEIATSSFARSFFGSNSSGGGVASLATARAGNVIGGGDWSEDRLVPDLWRAKQEGNTITLRYPDAVRPWQHVLEPLSGYFMFIEALAGGKQVPALNFGPDDGVRVSVQEVVSQFEASYSGANTAAFSVTQGKQLKEAHTLYIDPTKAKAILGWRPRLDCRQAVEWTAQWYAAFDRGEDPRQLTLQQIGQYENIAAVQSRRGKEVMA